MLHTCHNYRLHATAAATTVKAVKGMRTNVRLRRFLVKKNMIGDQRKSFKLFFSALRLKFFLMFSMYVIVCFVAK